MDSFILRNNLMSRKQLFNILKIVISVALIGGILYTIDIPTLVNVFRNANAGWLTAAAALMFLGIVVRAWRWQILLNSLQIFVSIRELTRIYLIGFLFNNLLPSGLGGDAIRMIELNRHSDHAGNAVTSVLVDRLIGLFGALTLALIALAFRWNAVPTEIAYVSLIIFGGIIFGGAALMSEALYQWVRKIAFIRKITDIKFVNSLFVSFQTYSLASLGKSYLVSLLFNAILIAMNVAIGTGLGANIALAHYLVFVPLTSLVLVLPISFAGLGVREGAYVYLFSQVGVAEEVALGMSLMIYFIGNVIPGLLGGVIYFWRSARGVKTIADANK
ncbi:MAG: hypothetical protein B6243_10170 [Anaerolineaceae bacterium 4572_5.2]|nr:MAG: hypothetical protein B6243_10170 [Anaerolineaceae bacterium 4572_5.2]